MSFLINLVVQIALPWKYLSLPLIFSYPHPVLIQQTFKGRPFRSSLSRDCPFIRRGKEMAFKNKNKTEKLCPLSRVINRSFKLLVFLILAAERNFRMCVWGGAVHNKKEKGSQKSKSVRALGMVKTREDNLVSFTKMTTHLVPLILVPGTLKIKNNFVTYNISEYLT